MTSPTEAFERLQDELQDLHEPYLVGDDYQFRTVQGAYDDAMREGVPPCIRLTDSYQSRRDDYPLTFNGTPDSREWLPFALDGQGTPSTIGHPDVTGDIIQIHGPPEGGQGSYKKPCTLSGFRMEGGTDGSQIHIAGLPNGRIRDVIAIGDGNGVSWTGPYLDMNEGVDQSHSFGWNLSGVTAWGGRTGFSATQSAGAHSTSFDHCRANANNGPGVYFEGAASVTWSGGDIQLNQGFGASVRNCDSFTLRDVYVEGNSRGKEFPIEIYGDGADGLTVDDCYCHGINPRGAGGHDYSWVQRVVNVHNSEGVTVKDNLARKYGDGLVTAMTGSAVEVHGNTFPEGDCEKYGRITQDSTVTEWGQPVDAVDSEA